MSTAARGVTGQEDGCQPLTAARRQVEVFGQRIVLPAAGVGDRALPPHPGRAREVEEAAAAVPRGVLHHEVAVEEDRLEPREERVLLVQVAPARLDAADLALGEVVDRLLEEVGLGDEVRVEQRDELALGGLKAVVERAGLVAVAVGAVDVFDVDALRAPLLDLLTGDLDRLIGRIVQHLDLELVGGVVDQARRVDQPLRDVHLIEDRELHRDGWKIFELFGDLRVALGVPIVEVHHEIAVEAVEAQDPQHHEIGVHHDQADGAACARMRERQKRLHLSLAYLELERFESVLYSHVTGGQG
jgi:hypothetical protein